MKSKKKLACLYCGKPGGTVDHVPSKTLLEKPYPHLITISACNVCNKSFSLDEEYFLNVLATVSLSPSLVKRTQPGGSIYRARDRKPGLYHNLLNCLITDEDGRTYLKPDNHRLIRIIGKYAFGLYYYKYGIRAPLASFKCTGFYPFDSEETRPAEIIALTHTERFVPKRWSHLQVGTFSYIVVKDWRRGNKLTMIFQMHNTAWCVVEIPSPGPAKRRLRNNDKQYDLFAQ